MKLIQDYDNIAAQIGEYIVGAVTEWTLGYPNLISILEPIEGKSILDYGCGAGNFSCFLNSKGAHVTGVDISKKMIQIAKDKNSAATFLWNPTNNLSDVLSSTFDAAALNFVLCTMPSASDIVSVLRQIYGFLQLGGICITLHTNWERCNGKEFASFRLNKVDILKSGVPIGLLLKSNPPIQIEDYFWSQDDYYAFYRESGFKDISVKEITANTKSHPLWVDEAITSPFYLISGRK